MEQNALLARLEVAKRRAKLGQDQIDHQRLVVASLFAAGAETTEAENRLRVYQKLHDRYLGDVERILIALDTVPFAFENTRNVPEATSGHWISDGGPATHRSRRQYRGGRPARRP